MIQTQQLQMQAMSSTTVNPGSTETQQMRVLAPAGVSLRPQKFTVQADKSSRRSGYECGFRILQEGRMCRINRISLGSRLI